MHPAHDDRVVFIFQAACVLRTNHRHTGLLQFSELISRRPAPETHVKIDAGRLVTLRVSGALQPDSDWEVIRTDRGAVLPLGIRRGVRPGAKPEPGSHEAKKESYRPFHFQ